MEFHGIPPEEMGPPPGMMPDDPALMHPPPDGMLDGYAPGMYPAGEFMEVKNLMVDGGNRFGVSTVVFDGQEELIWMGNHGGHVTSYYGLDMQKYTSFQMHESTEVRQMFTLDHNVFGLTSDGLRCFSKFGRPQFIYLSESMQDMQCMLQTGPNTVLMGGHQPLVVELDIETREEIRKVEVNEPGCAIFRVSNSYICSGDTSGKVTLRDPKTLSSEHVFEAHSGTLSDFDVHGTQLITCGFSNRMGNLTVDRFLMIYDLRMMRAMTPMQVPIEPMFLRFVPTYSNRICVISQSGQFQVMEQGAMTPNSMIMYQVQTEGASVSSFDISATYNGLTFGDNGGFLHLFTSTGESNNFNIYSSETEFPHMEHIEPISIHDELAPLSIIPMQYPTTGKLLSEWPEDMCRRNYRKPMRIDQEILRNIQMVQKIGYAPNPGTRRRNQISYKSTHGHGKRRERKSSAPESPLGKTEDPWLVIPKRYRKVEIKYSKLGVEDFDFRMFNKTNFAGLETHIPNAYCNAMLQVLYFIEPLRCALLSHTCDKEFCLACELGFLFHMFDKQKGKTCQANNFLRAFRTIPEASALGLVLSDREESMGRVNLPRLIQNWNRFILQQVHSELVESKKERDWMSQIQVIGAGEAPPLELIKLGEKEGKKVEKEEEKEEEKEAGETIAEEGVQGDKEEVGSVKEDSGKEKEKAEEGEKKEGDKQSEEAESKEKKEEVDKETENKEVDTDTKDKVEVADEGETKTENSKESAKKGSEEKVTEETESVAEGKEGEMEKKTKESEASESVAEEKKEVDKEEDKEPKEEGAEGKAEEVEEEKEEEQVEKEVPNSIIKMCFGSELENHFRCKCSSEQVRKMTSSIIDLCYPDITQSAKATPKQRYTFSEIVQRSMSSEQNTQAWCNLCNRYQPHLQIKKLKSLPDVLALNCHLENARDIEFWRFQEKILRKTEDGEPIPPPPSQYPARGGKMCRYGNTCTRKDCKFRHEGDSMFEPSPDMTKGHDLEESSEVSWVPIGLRIKLNDETGKVEVQDIEEEEDIPNHWEEEDVKYYDILATVAHIRDTKTGGNLVSHIKVGETYHQRKERVTCTQWYLYNDFSIEPIEKNEALYFHLDWKMPCVIYFLRRGINRHYDTDVKNPITSDVLFMNASLVTPRRKHITFLPLDEGELPKEGDTVGLDAEFVTLNQEEAELRSDGTRSTIKPSQMSVARITCIRGCGPLMGEAFIDDYISTQEQVVDYLTQFSGIQPGDLDASISSKHLTTLKATYLKLRYLVDVGVLFVGHGLKKDFRVINLVVPKEQIIDTAELYSLPRQRIMSLKFLAWYFHGIKIQSVTHDSIEDARTAIKLYLKYQEMNVDGMDNVRAKLKEMYDKGRKLGWKIPEETLEKGEDLTAEDIANLHIQETVTSDR